MQTCPYIIVKYTVINFQDNCTTYERIIESENKSILPVFSLLYKTHVQYIPVLLLETEL